MLQRKQQVRLKKELGLFDVYAIATPGTLSAGFFLIPGLAAAVAGPALAFGYLLAALLLIPGLISSVELGTAMPRSGGIYFFLDRSMGPMMGAVGGFGTFISLVLKTSFALIGMGAYIRLFLPDLPLVPIAAALAIVLGWLNIAGAKKSGSAQALLVFMLLILVAAFLVLGIPEIDVRQFQNVFEDRGMAIAATAGLVAVSFISLTKVVSVAEEVKNPERNLPLGMFLALGTALIVYVVGTTAMVGILGVDRLAGDLTPVASAASALAGRWGAAVMTIGAVLAFATVANSGILSASRYPLAMSRDHLLPRKLSSVDKQGTPRNATYVTVVLILLIVFTFDPTKIAKLASAFLLMTFAFSSLAVIVMRESKIDSYDPGYKTPFYPWIQLMGIAGPIWLITELGILSILFTVGVVLIGIIWYWYYARKRVSRSGAIYHVFERLGRTRDEGLDFELRGILKEKGLREEDPFDEIVARSVLIDLDKELSFEEVVRMAARPISGYTDMTADDICSQVMEGTRVGATPVTHGIALPHLRLPGINRSQMAIVRSTEGIPITFQSLFAHEVDEEEDTVFAVFLLVSPEDDPAQHLRILAQIAERVDEPRFLNDWKNATGEQQLKEVLLRDDRFLSLRIQHDLPTRDLIGKALREIDLPQDCLVAMCNRDGRTKIPRGDTVFQDGDLLTIIGHPDGIREIETAFA